MKLLKVFDQLSGFLFNPSENTEDFIKDLDQNLKNSHIFILYLSLLLGVSIWFLTLYPEPLYYGIFDPTAYYNIYTLELSNPLFLFLVIIATFIVIYFVNFIVAGTFDYRILKRYITRKDNNIISLGKYLASYAFSLSPLLFSIPVIALCIFFFEKIWIDLNIPTIIFFLIIGVLYIWQCLIQLKINMVMFKTSAHKAILPIIIRISCLITSLILFIFIFPTMVAYLVANFGGVG